MEVGGQHHAPKALLPEKRPGNHLTGDCVETRVGLEDAENFAHTAIRSLDNPVRSESLYRLRYLCPPHCKSVLKFLIYLTKPFQVQGS